MEGVDDGGGYVRLKQPLQVARDGAQRVAQAVEAPIDKVVSDEAGYVRALARLMIERGRDIALAFERRVDRQHVRDGERDDDTPRGRLEQSEEAHGDCARHHVAVADGGERDAAEVD